MSPPTERTGPRQEAGPTNTDVHIVTRRLRDWRIKKHARRELDDLLGVGLDPWQWSEPVGDVFRDGRLTVPERQHRGRELLAARWAP